MDRRRGMGDQGAAYVPRLVDLAPPSEVGNAEIGGDLGLGAGVHPPLHQSIDFAGLDAGIGKCRG